MKTFVEHIKEKDPSLEPNTGPFIESIKKNDGLDYLNENENAELERLVALLESEIGDDLEGLDESVVSRILGGAAGFLIGPTIGRVVAKALGVNSGILYDLFNSKLVGIALGTAIARHIEEKKRTNNDKII